MKWKLYEFFFVSIIKNLKQLYEAIKNLSQEQNQSPCKSRSSSSNHIILSWRQFQKKIYKNFTHQTKTRPIHYMEKREPLSQNTLRTAKTLIWSRYQHMPSLVSSGRMVTAGLKIANGTSHQNETVPDFGFTSLEALLKEPQKFHQRFRWCIMYHIHHQGDLAFNKKALASGCLLISPIT